MRYTRNFLSTLLIIVMLFSSFNVAFGATESSKSDIKGTWAETQISNWMDKGFIKGYQDGSFKPNNTVTRAEFFAMINRSFGFVDTANVSFSDLTSSNWASSEVSKAVKAGYITGYADGTIGVLNAISRQEVAVIVGRLLGLTNTQSAATTFTDSSLIASWAKASVQAAVAKDILKGYADDNSFKPNKFITRAEAVVTLERAIIANATKYSIAGTYGPTTGIETIHGDVIITVSGVTLQNIIITGNILFDAGIEEGDAFLKNVSIKGVTRVEGGGVNSIYLKNSNVPTLIVDKKKGDVRIVVEGSTIVGDATIKSPTTMQEKDTSGSGFSKVTLSELLPSGSKVTLIGGFDSLNIKGRQIQVDIPEGSVKEVTALSTATGMTLTLGKEARIVSLFLDAVAKILGTGTIEKVTLSSVAKNGTTIEITIRLLDRVNNTSTPTATSTGGSNTAPPTGGPDITAPMLSNVTIGQISLGDDVQGTSNESGYLYLVPSTTVKTIAGLDQSVADSLGIKLSVTANVELTISTTGLALGTYVVYAVDDSNNISMASANIVIGRKQLTIGEPVVTLVKAIGVDTSVVVSAGTLVGVAGDDVVTVSAEADIYDPLVVKDQTLNIVYTIGGADSGDYIAPANNTNYILDIKKSTINQSIILDLTTKSKVYDGTTVGFAIAGARDLHHDDFGKYDDLILTPYTIYDNKNVGTNKKITVEFILTGADAGNYTVPGYEVNVGEITAKQLTIAAPTLTFSKAYDGTTTAVVTPGALIGVISGDDITVHATATYNNAEVGTNKLITIVYTLTGADAGNYIAPVNYTISTGVISAR